jgi:hypothetical protein
LKKKVGNYQATTPSYREFCSKQCFSATIISILKQEDDIYYQLELGFNYSEGTKPKKFIRFRISSDLAELCIGDENTEGTFYSISIISADKDSKKEYRNHYINGECKG